MTADLSSFEPKSKTSFRIHSIKSVMSSSGRTHSYGSYASETDGTKWDGYRTGSYHQSSNQAIRNPALVPAYGETTSRRRSMNIEDMLNPSDENTRREQQPQSPRSYKASKPSRSGPPSHRAKASARSQAGSRPPPRGRGPGSPDIPSRTRAFRPGYTDEQELFIWYLRIDVRICKNNYPDPPSVV